MANVVPVRFLVTVLALAAIDASAAQSPTLNVPYLPQTEALCGGAAAAMVFRYWGDRHADIQQFESLVDMRAGGIADTALIDAIRSRGWNAQRLEGSMATILEQVAAGHPLILLIEDRPSRYHYVVAVGGDAEQVFVHDPTWGPDRRVAASELLRRWRPTGFWTLLVTAGGTVRSREPPTVSATHSSEPESTVCDRLLNEALDTIEKRGPSVADEALASVIQQCPKASGPLRELAGVRFSQQRWHDAAELAERALDRDREDAYAWDVLGSSRFIQNDVDGALLAWNHIGKPKLDSVQIAGLSRTRFAFVAQITALTPNSVLTPRQLLLASRRLGELPDRVTTAVGYRPDADGFATVNVDMVERSRGPHHAADWISLGVQAAIDREISVAIPGNTGQGELWDASWRWWGGRPRVAASFSAPRAGRLGGIWRVNGFWEAQTYGAQQIAGAPGDIRQQQTHGAISFSNWVMPNFRFEASSGIDVWSQGRSDSDVVSGSDVMSGPDVVSGFSRTARTVFVGGSVEQRLLTDHVSVAGSATAWSPAGAGEPFRAASIRVAAQSSPAPAAITILARVRTDFASAQAPLAIWSGAGDGRARPGLLRAHPLLDAGVIDGPAFGRRVQSATLEVQRWFKRLEIPRVGIAAFADAAHATNRLTGAPGRPFQLDAGSGLRIRVPGSDRTLRIDYAHGLRDRHASAVTVGIVTGILN